MTPEEKLDRIRELAAELGWELAMSNESEEVHGIIIGDMQFITDVLNGDIDPEAFGIYASAYDEELH